MRAPTFSRVPPHVRTFVTDVMTADHRRGGALKGLAARWMSYVGDARYRRVFRDLLRRAPDGRHVALSAGSRVLHFCGSLGAGGTERQMVTTIGGLQERGWTKLGVTCVYLDPPQDFYQRHLHEMGVPVSRLPSLESAVSRDEGLRSLAETLPLELRDIARYVAAIREAQADIVHAWLDETNIKAGFAALLAAVPRVVLSCRSVAPTHFGLYQPYMREGYRTLLKIRRVHVLNNSVAGAADYAAWLGCDARRFAIVRNGFRGTARPERVMPHVLATLSQCGVGPHSRVVGGVLRLSEEKRPLLWIESAAAVAALLEDCHFVLVGDGPLRGVITERVRELGLEHRIHLLGQQQGALDWIRAFHVLLLTSRQEGCPNVLLEAQAIGIPVVTTAAGGAAETVNEGVTGSVVADATADALARRVLGWLNDEAGCQRVEAAGPRWIRERFCISMLIDHTIHAYVRTGSTTGGTDA